MAPKARLAFTSWVRHLPAILGVVLLIGAIYVVQREFHHLRLKDIGAALSAIPARALVFSFVSTIVSYFILTFYDRLGTIYAGHKVSYGRVAFASFCAYALSHNIGFCGGLGRRRSLPALRPLGPDPAADRQDGGVLQPDFRASAAWFSAVPFCSWSLGPFPSSASIYRSSPCTALASCCGPWCLAT